MEVSADLTIYGYIQNSKLPFPIYFSSAVPVECLKNFPQTKSSVSGIVKVCANGLMINCQNFWLSSFHFF